MIYVNRPLLNAALAGGAIPERKNVKEAITQIEAECEERSQACHLVVPYATFVLPRVSKLKQ